MADAPSTPTMPAGGFAEQSSHASFSPTGEFLIGGLGVDGRDCTRDEPGWAEPGSMSALWGQKPPSPKKTRREVALRPIIAASEPLAELGRTVSHASCGSKCHKCSRCRACAGQSVALQLAAECRNCPSAPSARPRSASQRSGSGSDASRAPAECAQCMNQLLSPRRTFALSPMELGRNLKGRLRGRSQSSAGSDKIDDGLGSSLAAIDEEDDEQGTALGGNRITVVDIIQGRTCRPISLMDLRAFLASQRSEENRTGLYQPASALARNQAVLPDLSMLGGTALSPSSSPVRPLRELESDSGAFAAFDSEKTLVSNGRESPDQLRRSRSKRARRTQVTVPGDELDAVNFLASFYRWQKRFSNALAAAELGSSTDVVDVDEAGNSKKGALPQLASLRKEMLEILTIYLGQSDDATEGQASPRLAWMWDLGLIPEATVAAARSAAQSTTHPEVLAPTVSVVIAYLNRHVVPAFFLSKAKNLGRHTERGRLMVGLVCTTIAIVLTVLMAVKPSPLYTGPNKSGNISRWYRLLLAPLWCAGIGYIMAAWTGVCVWLSLRGNREPSSQDNTHRGAEIRSVLTSGDHESISSNIVAEEEQDRSARQRWIAPELEKLLVRLHLWKASPKEQPTLPKAISSASLAPPAASAQRHSTLGLGPPLTQLKSIESDARFSPSTSPIVAPSPAALLISSPSVKSKRLPGLPLEVAVISRPAFILEGLPAAATQASLAPTATGKNRKTPTASVMSMSGANPAWTRSATDGTAVRTAWTRIKQATGFAAHTEPVLDENVRREQQRAALRALAICSLITATLLIVVVAVP